MKCIKTKRNGDILPKRFAKWQYAEVLRVKFSITTTMQKAKFLFSYYEVIVVVLLARQLIS